MSQDKPLRILPSLELVNLTGNGKKMKTVVAKVGAWIDVFSATVWSAEALRIMAKDNLDTLTFDEETGELWGIVVVPPNVAIYGAAAKDGK